MSTFLDFSDRTKLFSIFLFIIGNISFTIPIHSSTPIGGSTIFWRTTLHSIVDEIYHIFFFTHIVSAVCISKYLCTTSGALYMYFLLYNDLFIAVVSVLCLGHLLYLDFTRWLNHFPKWTMIKRFINVVAFFFTRCWVLLILKMYYSYKFFVQSNIILLFKYCKWLLSEQIYLS